MLPLPQTWHQDNKQLQVRPVLSAAAAAAATAAASATGEEAGRQPPSHSWSFGASNGQHSVQLTGLEDGGTRLLCCMTLGPQPRACQGGVLRPLCACPAPGILLAMPMLKLCVHPRSSMPLPYKSQPQVAPLLPPCNILTPTPSTHSRPS